jgi:hypothetical protein
LESAVIAATNVMAIAAAYNNYEQKYNPYAVAATKSVEKHNIHLAYIRNA